MKSFRRIGVAALVLAAAGWVGACETLPTVAPANSPPPLSFAERGGRPGILHSDVIEATGAVVLAEGAVERGGLLVRFPYRYRHTAVLTEDVTGFSITVPGVQAPAGAPGYYAGTFMSGGFGSGPNDLWCFVKGGGTSERETLCLLRNQATVAAIAPTRMNPLLWTRFASATGSFNYVNTPIFERRPVEIPGDLTLEYRFEGWRDGAARLSEHAGGRKVRDFELRPPMTLDTVAGHFAIWPDPADPARAAIRTARMDRLAPSPAPAG